MTAEADNWEINIPATHNDNSSLYYNIDNITTPAVGSQSLEALSIIVWLRGFELIPMWLLKVPYGIIFITGAIANLFLLSYIVGFKRYKSPVFFIILSLGVSDTIVCIGSALWTVVIHPIMLGPLWLCQISVLLQSVSFPSSSYHVVLFAILRYFQLVYPLASRAKVTTKLLSQICVAIWTAGFIQAIIFLVFIRLVKIQYKFENEIYVCWYSGNPQIAFLWVLSFWVIGPFLITAGFHIAKHVLVLLRRSDSSVMAATSDQAQQGRRQTDSRAVAIVIVVYLITILPNTILYLRIYALGVANSPIHTFLLSVFQEIAYSNSAINPWIYLFAAGSVRNDIRNMFTRGRSVKR